MKTEQFAIEVEADVKSSAVELLENGVDWYGDEKFKNINIQLRRSEEGRGFGLTEVLTVVVSVGVSVSSDLIDEAIRTAVGGVIRRVRTPHIKCGGSKSDISEVINKVRNSHEDSND